MNFTFRCILDVEEDVIRDLQIDSKKNLQDLHQAIVSSFGFSSQEMAAFYRTDNEWEQGEEIPLFNMNDAGISNEMKDFKLSDLFSEDGEKLLYVFDFLAMWTFFIELKSISDKKQIKEFQVIFKTGETPKESPNKKFEAKKKSDDIDNDFDDEFGEEFDDNFDFDSDFNNLY